MSKKNEPQPRKESSSLLGWMALFAVIAAIVVFAFTRSSGPPEPTTAQAPAPVQTSAPPAPQPPAPVPESASSHDDHSGHNHGTPTASQGGGAPKPLPPFHENPDAAEPLAPTRDPASVAPHAKDAYVVAMKKPRLMAQLPCFCYCDRFGHKSLHDCFVSNHAEECDICMKEALEADRMDAQGMTPKEIRSIVISTYYQRS